MMLEATPIIRAVPIKRLAEVTVFDLHMACGHVLVSEAAGPDRDNPMRGWHAMCCLCGDPESRLQPDMLCYSP